MTWAISRYVEATALLLSMLSVPGSAFGQTPTAAANTSALHETHSNSRASELLRQFNTSLVSLTKEVTPAVVQIMVTSYGPVQHGSEPGNVALFARQRDVGSGVILDPDGYIITNAHVVERAQRIRVALPVSAGGPFDVAGARPDRICESPRRASEVRKSLGEGCG